MTILLTILMLLLGLVVLLLIYGLFGRKVYNVKREVIVQAPVEKVFDYLRHMKNQQKFNKWVMVDPAMKNEYRGTDGTSGFVYAWNGNKQAGEGELEIKNIIENKRIETEVRFVRPMPGIAHANWIVTAETEGKSRISWNNEAELKYPFNIMIGMIEKMLGKDMDFSLQNLKNILEK